MMWMTLMLAPLLAAAEPAAEAEARIVLVGDSTVTDGAGWGAGFKALLAPGVECINTAAGGRSSKSFRAEGRWDQAVATGADYILIQFGHNDQPGKGPEREAPAETDYRENMRRYVDEARAAGMKPVLVTSLARRAFDETGRIRSSLLPWVEAVKGVAAEAGVPVIDLHTRSVALYELLGPEGCEWMAPAKADGYDGTHLNARGSGLIGLIVADELRKIVPELAPYVRLGEAYRAVAEVASVSRVITVAGDGSGDFSTVQAAVDAVPAGNADRVVITIRPGIYRGHIVVPADKPFITFRGEDAATTILTDDKNVHAVDAAGNKLSSRDSSSTVLEGHDFVAENVTFENTAGNHGQAMAAFVAADRSIFRNCGFLGWQDTLRLKAGRSYFEDCEIVGSVDFIYGSGTAYFERCRIHCIGDGWITAASTEESEPHGYVFRGCVVTAAEGVKRVYLGRPWRPFASVAFLETELPAALAPEGWHNWGKQENEKTARYAEFDSRGPGAAASSRVAWSRQLTREEADALSVRAVLGGDDGWDPTE